MAITKNMKAEYIFCSDLVGKAANRTGGRLTGRFGTEPGGTPCPNGTRWNRNQMEPEPAEPDFDPYIGARKLNFRTVWSFWDENPAMSIFSMRGIRWFQREFLKRLI